ARAMAKQLQTELAIIDKRRPEANKAEVMNIIGDVEGRTCLLIDDIIDTAGTLCNAANALKDKGAQRVIAYCTHPVLSGKAIDNAGTLCNAANALKDKGAQRVIAYCTHPVLSGKAIDNINNSQLDTLVVTNSIPLSPEARACSRIRQLSLGRMLAEAVRRVSNEESISAMFI